MKKAEFLHNTHFLALTNTKQFKDFVRALEKVLYHQWEDIVMSGIVNEAQAIIKKDYLNSQIKKAVRREKVLPLDNGEVVIENIEILLPLLIALVKKKLKQFKKYFTIQQDFYQVLQFAANKGGQSILDQISDATNVRPKTFNLTKQEYTDKIKRRVDGLMPTLDDTTTDRFAKELLQSFKEGDSKKETVNQLLKVGAVIAAYRALRIANTEVNSVYEYIRHVTALENNIIVKTWKANIDERTCATCAGNNNITVLENEQFPSGHGYPVAHPNCRCYVLYSVVPQSEYKFIIYTTNKAFHGAPEAFYGVWTGLPQKSIINPEFIWNGSDNKVGKDKRIDFYKEHIKVDLLFHVMTTIGDNGEMIVNTFARNIGNIIEDPKTTEDYLINARIELTDIGFLQLLRCLGYSGNVSGFYGLGDIADRTYTDEDKIQAQHFLYTEQSDNIVDISSFGIKKHIPNIENAEVKGNVLLDTNEIMLSKDTIKYHRVWNIINNFQEAQKKSDNGIIVYKQGDVYVVLEGNHRVVAAKYLEIDKILASKVYILQ